MRYKILMLVALGALAISGCSLREHYFGYPNHLKGSWEFKDKSLGPMVLKFDKYRRFTVDSNNDGKRDIWGSYEIFENRIKFTDDLPRLNTDCYEAGFYYYSVVRGELHFDLLADHCKPRKYILDLPFVRAKHKK